MTTTETSATSGLPVLLGLRELQKIFPKIAQNTVYRWNSDSGGRAKQLPPPFRVVSGTPMWTESQILAFAAAKGLDLDLDQSALDGIRRSQAG